MTLKIRLTVIAIVAAVNTVSCLAFSAPEGRKDGGGEQFPQPPPAPWEEKAGDLYVSRGVSKIEKVGSRHVLTTFCAGTHSVYAEGGEGVTLDKYLGGFVRARYVYSTAVNSHVRCVQAPCELVAERIAVIMSVEPVPTAETERMWDRRTCTRSAYPERSVPDEREEP